MDWTQIILALLAIISAVVTRFLIPWLIAKVGEEKLSKLDYWLRIFIAAAETAFGSSEGAAKKAWVLQRIRALGLEFDEQVILDAIDGLCRELTASAVINDGK